jgi:hypothetical protein
MLEYASKEASATWFFHPFRIDDADLKRCMFFLDKKHMPTDEELAGYVINERCLDEESYDLLLLEFAALLAKGWVRTPNEQDEDQQDLYGSVPRSFAIQRIEDHFGLDPHRTFRQHRLGELIPILSNYDFNAPVDKEHPPLFNLTKPAEIKTDGSGDPLWSFDINKLEKGDLKKCVYYCMHDRMPNEAEVETLDLGDLSDLEPDHITMIEVSAMFANKLLHPPHPTREKHSVVFLDADGRVPADFDPDRIVIDPDDGGPVMNFYYYYKYHDLENLVPILAKYDFNN